MAVQVHADDMPDSSPVGVSHVASRVIARAEAMGLVPPVNRYDGAALASALKGFEEHGIGRQLQASGVADAAMGKWLGAIEHSPLPGTEWRSMLNVLGEELLVRVLGVSPSSVRRYGRGERPTPDRIAERLHAVTLVVADLAGSYNDYGIRRWFDRPRTPLGNRSPADVLSQGWSDEASVETVRQLASSLTAPLAS